MRKLLLSILSLFAFAIATNAAEITIDPDGEGVTWTAETDATYGPGFKSTINGLNVAIYKSTSTSDLVTPTDLIKVYKNAVLVIETQDGSNISNLVMTCSESSRCKDMTDVDDSKVYAANTTNLTITWTGSKNKVILKATAGQSRVSSIAVTTVAAGGIAAPTFSVAAGTYYEAQTVEITNPNGSGKVYYTTNGDDPTAESTEYTAPIEITATTTLKAIVVDGDKSSEITSATYTITTMPEVDNIAAFKKLGKGGIAKITCPLTVAAVYTNKSNYVNYYVQDEDGDGIVIFGAIADLPEYEKTDIIPAGFTGTYAEYNGLPEIIDCEGLAEATETGTIVTTATTIEEIGTDAICSVVELSGAEILDIDGSKFNIKDESTTVAAYNKFGLETIEAYTGIKIVGIVDVHNGEVQILPIEIDYKEGTADEAEISDDDDIVVSTGDGSIIVEGGDVIQVVTPDGRATTVKGSGDTPDRRRRIIETENGIYIVVVDGEVVEKVYVE